MFQDSKPLISVYCINWLWNISRKFLRVCWRELAPVCCHFSCDNKMNPKNQQNHRLFPKNRLISRYFTHVLQIFSRTSLLCGPCPMAPGTPGDPARSWGNGHVHRAKLGIKVQQKFLQGLQPISRLARGQKTTAQGCFFFRCWIWWLKNNPFVWG